MKAERRHELKQNTLAATLFNLPEIGRKYGSRIAMGVILLALLIIWIRVRMNTNAEHLASARRSLTDAMLDLQRLENQASVANPADAIGAAQQRQIWYADGLSRADDAIKLAGDQDTQIKAQALRVKGDLNFDLSNLPDLPGATTQPSLLPQPGKTDLLSQAEDAYKQLLQDYPQQHFEVMAAHFGLAAVAENRATLDAGKDSTQWDEAGKEYQAVIDDIAVSPSYKEYALYRQQLLPQLRQPALIGLLPPSATQPSTLPMLGPSLGPATLPTTQSAVK